MHIYMVIMVTTNYTFCKIFRLLPSSVASIISHIQLYHIQLYHISLVTFYIFQSFYNIIENTLMKVGSPVDVPTTVSMLIYIHQESQVSISALVQH